MWSNKSNEVPLQNPRHNQNKDSTRGMDFLCFIALFWKMFYHELFETLGSFYRKHSPASIWKLRPCVVWLPFCRDSSFRLWSAEYLLICIRNCQPMIWLPRWHRVRFFWVLERSSSAGTEIGNCRLLKEVKSLRDSYSWLLLSSKVAKS